MLAMRYFVVLGTLKAKLPLYKKMESKYEKMEVVIFHPAAFSNSAYVVLT
jgi:hypothetical protein